MEISNLTAVDIVNVQWLKLIKGGQVIKPTYSNVLLRHQTLSNDWVKKQHQPSCHKCLNAIKTATIYYAFQTSCVCFPYPSPWTISHLLPPLFSGEHCLRLLVLVVRSILIASKTQMEIGSIWKPNNENIWNISSDGKYEKISLILEVVDHLNLR